MDMKALVRRVERRLEKLDLTHTEASRRATNSTETIRNWMRAASAGKDQGATVKTLEPVARVLGTTVRWLVEEEGPEEPIEDDGSVQVIPHLSWISAGSMMQDDVSQVAIGTIQVSVLSGKGDWIALTVRGDSMDRISPPESLIFVNRKDKALVANACYVIDDGEGNATYKRYRPDPARFEPVSTNDEHQPLFPDNDPTIIGRVGLSMIKM